VHIDLEFFGANDRDKEIAEEQQRDDCDNCFHLCLLKLLAEAHIEGAHHEEADDNAAEN
jgi:hypothetical protein